MKSYCICLILSCVFPQLLPAQNNLDTVFTFKRDTLVGKIILNKEKNKFFMATDSNQFALNPLDISSFVTYNKDDDYERKEYNNLLGSFYVLELGKNDLITIYSKTTYKTTEEYGQKYFTAKKDYCFFKNDTPYFYRPENRKETLLFLVQDCPIVVLNLKNKKYQEDDPMSIILEYNKCGSILKK